MSVRVAVAASKVDAALAGLDGAPGPGACADVVVALADAAVPEGAPQVRWLRTAAGPADAGGAERVIAPAGEGVWRRAPWPVRDELFELPLGGGVVVAGGDPRERSDIARDVSSRGIEAVEVERLDLDSLRGAGAVVLLDAPGGALAAEVPAVLAARRVLVTRPCDPSFGFQAGIDHLRAASPSELVQLAAAAVERPRAFAELRAFGALAAERHRASVVYERLARDVAELGL